MTKLNETLYTIKVSTITGEEIPLERYQGKVLLIVNVASKCGFTGQYEGLQQLHEKYASQGLSILGFPCNQFLSQEPGTEEEIASFCSLTYGVSFDMFSKVAVNGKHTHPLYRYLKGEAGGLLGGAIKWNFTKFLVDHEGHVYKRYAPSTPPQKLEGDIKKLLTSLPPK